MNALRSVNRTGCERNGSRSDRSSYSTAGVLDFVEEFGVAIAKE